MKPSHITTSAQSIQLTSHIMLVRPKHFAFNPQTASDNGFMHPDSLPKHNYIRQHAHEEFQSLVSILQAEGVRVSLFEDMAYPFTPDSVFPNNWISFHQTGELILYPMYAPNRRWERKPYIIQHFLNTYPDFKLLDLSSHEDSGHFLEGTGSMVLDRVNHIAYACLSERTHDALFREFCAHMNYQPLSFHAYDAQGVAIYHTNVMMSVGQGFAVVCLESISDEKERQSVQASLAQSGHELIPISYEQMLAFAGNVLQIQNQQGKPLLVLSQRAFDSLNPTQLNHLRHYSRLVVIPLDVIEYYGGGGVRCMMAEVFIPS